MRARGTELCPVIVHGSPVGSIGYWKKNAKQVGSQKNGGQQFSFSHDLSL